MLSADSALEPEERQLLSTLPWHGPRTRLRRITVNDAELIARIDADPDLTRHLGGPKGNTPAFVATAIADGRGLMPTMMLVERSSDSLPIGYCAMFLNHQIGSGQCDMLIALLKEHQGMGYGKEVLVLLRDSWLTVLRKKYCTATVSKNNVPSVKLLESCGFVRHGECESKAGLVHIYRFPASAL